MGDAYSIEQAFGDLLGHAEGQRGLANDADVFRLGAAEGHAKILELAAEAIERRSKALGLDVDNAANGSPPARIGAAIHRLREWSENLEIARKGQEEEGETYQWEVIGAFVAVAAALLEEMTQRTT